MQTRGVSPGPDPMAPQHTTDNVRIIPLLGAFWTPANMLSLSRLLLVAPITYLIYVDGSLAWLIGLVMLAAVTDFFDGQLARWSHTVSEWGKVLDPLADKALGAMVVLALVFREAEPQLPVWLLLLILVRDTTLVGGGIILAKKRGHVVMSTWSGKIAVCFLALTVVATLLSAPPMFLSACVWTTALLLSYSLFRYTIRYFAIMRGESLPPEPSLKPARAPSVPTMKQEAGSMQG